MRRADDIQTLRWGIQALRLLGERESLSCAEIVKALGISRPAAYRLVGTLQSMGHVARIGAPRRARYSLAARVQALSNGSSGDGLLLEVAQPLLLRFTESQGWPLALGVPARDRCFVVYTTDHATSRLLSRRTAGYYESYQTSALGQVCLAGLSEPLRRSCIARLVRGESDDVNHAAAAAELDARSRQVSEQRYARHDQIGAREFDLAVPLYRGGRFVAGLNIRYMRVASGGDAGHRQRLAWLGALAAAIETQVGRRQAESLWRKPS